MLQQYQSCVNVSKLSMSFLILLDWHLSTDHTILGLSGRHLLNEEMLADGRGLPKKGWLREILTKAMTGGTPDG